MKTLDLFPWKIRVNKEKTSEYYSNKDLSSDKELKKLDKELNDAFKKVLNSETLKFISDFGVDIDKLRVELTPDFYDEGKLIFKGAYLLEFIFAGEFVAIPSKQWDFYFGSAEDEPAIFEIEETIPEKILIDVFFHQTADKMGIYKFSPAAVYDESFEGWNSGYIFCKALFRL